MVPLYSSTDRGCMLVSFNSGLSIKRSEDDLHSAKADYFFNTRDAVLLYCCDGCVKSQVPLYNINTHENGASLVENSNCGKDAWEDGQGLGLFLLLLLNLR